LLALGTAIQRASATHIPDIAVSPMKSMEAASAGGNTCWIREEIPKTLFAKQCFIAAQHMQTKNPGIEATAHDLMTPTETHKIRYA